MEREKDCPGRVSVMIPVYKPNPELRSLLLLLIGQSVKPHELLLINTEEKYFDESLLKGLEAPFPIRVLHISKAEFDHGGTRHFATTQTEGELLLFLTQDALPKDERLIEVLQQAFLEERVSAAYARQLPREDCCILEKYTREFNYPEESRIKTKEDLPELGIKTFFCSNVCAMYRRSTYEALGGFERHTIFNEDMIFAGKLVFSGGAIAYCAKAMVIHSHNYTGLAQLHRNFDLGVSQAEHPELFSKAPSEGEGLRMVWQSARRLLKNGRPQLLPKLFWQSACKLTGYRLGKAYRRLPDFLIRWCTMNKAYWER